jgi:hypothetical protein
MSNSTFFAGALYMGIRFNFGFILFDFSLKLGAKFGTYVIS